MFDGTTFEEPQVVKDLRVARKHLEQGWCKGAQGLDANGQFVATPAREAVRFCLGGAISQAIGQAWTSNPHTRCGRAMDAISREIGARGFASPNPAFGDAVIPWFNNAPGTTIDDIFDVVDGAIALALTKEAAHV